MVDRDKPTPHELLELPTVPRGRARSTTDVLVNALTVLWHPDSRRVGDVSRLIGLLSGKTITVSRLEPIFAAPGRSGGSPLAEPSVSRRGLTISQRGGTLTLTPNPAAPEVCVRGAAIRGPVVLTPEDVEAGVDIELSDSTLLLLHNAPARDAVGPDYGLVGGSAGIRATREAVAKVCDMDVPVLICGPSGTGKELVARALHSSGLRSAKPFVAVNLAAVPESVAASELFGHVRGAFTGATSDRPGYFRSADRGTLFLDEVGDAPDGIQVALLRALETGEIQAVGARSPRVVDVRLIAATDADLERGVADGHFRQALLQRLGGYRIEVSPLAERREDIGRLLVHFLRPELRRTGEEARLVGPPGGTPWLSAGLVGHLVRHEWPGNVRELRNVVRQLVIANRGRDHVQLDAALTRLLAPATDDSSDDPPTVAPVRRKPADIAEEELIAALRANGWRFGAAAGALGISRTAMFAKVEASPRIRRPKDVPDAELRAAHAACGGDLDRMSDQLEISARGVRLRLTEIGIE